MPGFRGAFSALAARIGQSGAHGPFRFRAHRDPMGRRRTRDDDPSRPIPPLAQQGRLGRIQRSEQEHEF